MKKLLLTLPFIMSTAIAAPVDVNTHIPLSICEITEYSVGNIIEPFKPINFDTKKELETYMKKHYQYAFKSHDITTKCVGSPIVFRHAQGTYIQVNPEDYHEDNGLTTVNLHMSSNIGMDLVNYDTDDLVHAQFKGGNISYHNYGGQKYILMITH